MDYLIFAIGLFLSASGVACLLLRRLRPSAAAWRVGAVSFFAMAVAGWLGMIGFGLDADPVMEVLVAGAVALSTGMMAKFYLRTMGAPGGVGTALALVVGAATAWVAWYPPLRPAVPAIVSLMGAGFGWALGRVILPEQTPARPRWKWLPVVAMALMVGTILWPSLLETVHDTRGDGFAPIRLGLLGLLIMALATAGGTAALLWHRLELAGCQLSHGAAARLAVGSGRRIAAAFLLVVILGGVFAEWIGTKVEKARIQHLLDTVKIGASSLDGDVLATMSADTSDMQDADYSVVQRRLRDLRASLPGCRFVYTAGLRGKDFVYLVDSEALTSPSFSPPGKVILDDPAKWVGALAGDGYFGGPRRDARGAWFTALLPVWDSSRNSSSIIAVDYLVREWLRPVVIQRLGVMWGVLVVAMLLLGYAVHRQRAFEQAARLSSLTERLSHAMEAADFDAIDWYPDRGRVLLGERLAAKLGVAGQGTIISFRSFWKRIHPEDRPVLAFRLRHPAGSVEQNEELEVRLLDRNAHPFWVILRGRLATSPGEGNPHVTGIVLNVHESKRSMLELERQRMFARQVMDAVHGGVAVLDGSGAIKFVNRTYCRMAMMAEAFLVKTPYQRTLEIGPEVGEDKTRFEARIKRGDGSTLPVKVFRSPFSDSGQERGTILTISDISAIKDAEHALLNIRAEAKRLSLVARKIDAAVISTDPDGRIGWVNDGFTRLTGYSRAEVTGRKPGSFLQGPDMDPEVREFMRERIRAGEGFQTEVWNHTKEGVAYLAHIDCHPVTDDAGELTGFLAIQRDVTRERKTESALGEQQARMDEISRCLLALGADRQENFRQLLGLLVAHFGVARAVYCSSAGGTCTVVSAVGPGAVPAGEGDQRPVADLLVGTENSLLVADIDSSPYALRCPDLGMAGYRSLAGHTVAVDGNRMGAIMSYFEKPGETSPEFLACMALIAGILGREETVNRTQPE